MISIDTSLLFTAQYSAEGATSCTDCPVGQSCASPDATPVPCDPGQYSAAAGVCSGIMFKELECASKICVD